MPTHRKGSHSGQKRLRKIKKGHCTSSDSMTLKFLLLTMPIYLFSKFRNMRQRERDFLEKGPFLNKIYGNRNRTRRPK